MKKIFTLFCITSIFISKSFCQLPNNSFETWSAGLPNGWFAALIPGYNILEQSTDAHSGSYCAKLNVVDISGNPYGSSLYTGDVNGLTTPISYVPGSVDFWYKMTATGGDQLSAVVFVYGGGALVGLGSVQLNSAAGYTQAFLSVLNVTGATSADSINVTFLINNPAGITHIGTTAQIDDVTLTVASGINDINNSNNALMINPNPASAVVNLVYESKKSNTAIIEIYDAKGKLGKSLHADVVKGSNRISIDTGNFTNGTYHCILTTGSQSFTKSFIVKK